MVDADRQPSEPPPLRGHLGDFETTTADLLRPREARALLNFAALFHETIYLTDTALGDHRLLLESFREDPHVGLFSHVSRLMEVGILRVLCRDRVVVREDVLVAREPTIQQIVEGWRHRDRVAWAGETGLTTSIEPSVRLAYCREVDELLSRCNAIQRYDPDIPKAAFRERIRQSVDSAERSMLGASVAALPTDARRSYLAAIEDPWFTNAELWRVVRRTDLARELIILHGHIQQQCFADITQSGQCGEDRSQKSLASFNLELQRQRPMALEIDATLEPPASLDALMERAAVRLNSPGIEMFEHLSVEQIVGLRRRAAGMFRLARTSVTQHDLEDFRGRYLKALENYWSLIIEAFAEQFPGRMKHAGRVGLFAEEQLPTLGRLYSKFGKSIVAILLRLGLTSVSPGGGAAAGPVTDVVHRIGVAMLYEQTQEATLLRGRIPPPEWKPQGLLGLSRFGRSSEPQRRV